MDPLSATASVIAILQLSSEIFKYVNTVTDASKDRDLLRNEVKACRNILQQLADEADDSVEGKAWSETIKTLEAPGGPLCRLQVALDMMKTKLQYTGGLRRSLKWPFQEKEVQKIVASIEREKSLLSLALENNSRKLLQEVTKCSKENRQQLTELVNLVEGHWQDQLGHFGDLRNDMSSILHRVDSLRERQDTQQTSEAHREVLEWLTAIDFTSQQHDYLARRQADTGQWLIESDIYQRWIKAEKKTLFCPGIPGAGKTILTSIIVDDICERYRDDPTVGLAYIYCNFRRQEEQNIPGLMASLLKQLTAGKHAIPQIVKDLYNRHTKKRTRPSPEKIFKALQSVIESYSIVFILVDALDECEQVCRTRLLSELFNLQRSHVVQFLATSRHIPEITERFKGSEVLEILASDEDVAKYLKGQMTRLPGFVQRNVKLRQDIEDQIVGTVQGMFLLAQLYLNSLIGKTSLKMVRAALARLKSGTEAYDYAYRGAMERIEGQLADQEQLAKQVLSWITCARRPLTTSELQHALGVELGELELDEDNFAQIEDMVSVCAGLVTVDEETDIIRLVHYTAQEYFGRTRREWFPDAHTDMTRICITYLSFDIFQRGFCTKDEELEERLQQNNLYEYAARNWGHHARVSTLACVEVRNFLVQLEKVEASNQVLLTRRRGVWDYNYSSSFPRNMVGLHLAAYFGIEDVATGLLREIADVDVKNTYGRTPLSLAAENGHDAVVKLLLDKGAAADTQDENGWTPLSWAAMNGHEAIVRLLLNKGAAANSQSKISWTPLAGWTPLANAVRCGHEAIVKLLLKEGAIADTQDGIGRTSLSLAVEYEQEAIVKLLLEENATVDTQDKRGRTPLSLAADFGHEVVVKLLLDKGAAADSQDEEGRTPLSLAAEYGREAVVKLLLDKGAVADSQDKKGKTPLSWAAEHGCNAVVKLLLDKGAAADSQDEKGRTPLANAARYRHEAVVKLLLEEGASADIQDEEGWTPLSLAADSGQEATVKLLLKENATVDTQDKNGWTPLSLAAECGHEAIVQLLLNKGAAADTQDENGWTPLSWAAVHGHEAVVRFLLNKGAAADSQNNIGQTTLAKAARYGHEAIVKLLLDKGAVADSQDNQGRTPLSLAAEYGHEAVVKLLLDKGAAADSQDEKGWTPLSLAATHRHEAIVKLLNASEKDNARVKNIPLL